MMNNMTEYGLRQESGRLGGPPGRDIWIGGTSLWLGPILQYCSWGEGEIGTSNAGFGNFAIELLVVSYDVQLSILVVTSCTE